MTKYAEPFIVSRETIEEDEDTGQWRRKRQRPHAESLSNVLHTVHGMGRHDELHWSTEGDALVASVESSEQGMRTTDHLTIKGSAGAMERLRTFVYQGRPQHYWGQSSGRGRSHSRGGKSGDPVIMNAVQDLRRPQGHARGYSTGSDEHPMLAGGTPAQKSMVSRILADMNKRGYNTQIHAARGRNVVVTIFDPRGIPHFLLSVDYGEAIGGIVVHRDGSIEAELGSTWPVQSAVGFLRVP
jgi:hypothetical protein